LGFSFFFTLWVSKSFSPRYVFGITLFPSLLFAYLLCQVSHSRVVALLTFPFLFYGISSKATHYNPEQAYQTVLSFLENSVQEDNLPIVIDGDPFVALKFAASKTLRPRLQYVLQPKAHVYANPAADRQISRLATIFDDMSVSEFDAFIKNNPRFYVVTLNNPAHWDSIESAFERKTLIGPVLMQTEQVRLRCAGEEGVNKGCADVKHSH
jgi:hypothetical protein